MPFIYTSPELKFPATQQVGPDSWILELPFWHVDPKTGLVTFIPPSGLGTPEEIVQNPVWTTDYRSGGAAVDLLIDKQGQYSAAWLKHDFRYGSKTKSRRQSDVDLYYDLKELGANLAQREAVYVGLRLGGASAWNGHKTEDVRKLRDWAQYCLPLFTMPTDGLAKSMSAAQPV